MKFEKYLNEEIDGVRLLTPIRKKINAEIAKLTSNKYHQKIPLKDIDDILKKYDMGFYKYIESNLDVGSYQKQ
jgi:hypothetical protein